MFNAREFYRKYNDAVYDSYEKSLFAVKEIRDETEGCSKCKGKKEYCTFFNHTAKLILKLIELEKELNDNYFLSKTVEELLKENNELYSELLPSNYEMSYANPSYAVKVFGNDFGQLFSALYLEYRNYISYAYKHKIYKMEEYNRLFVDVFDYIKNGDIQYEELKRIISGAKHKNLRRESEVNFMEAYNGDYGYYSDPAKHMDLNDLRYLFRFGEFISDNELKTAEFLNSYPDSKLKILSEVVAKAYVNGFTRDNKDITLRSTVRIVYNIGQERIIRQLGEDLRKYNLESFINRAVTTDANKQFEYDHRFDNALYLDNEYVKLKEEEYEKTAEYLRPMLSKYSGIIYFDKFGELPFTPVNKAECLSLTDEQSKLFQGHRNKLMQILDRYVPNTETSFCIVAFPTPEIGSKFEEIYEDTLKVNMQDSAMYEEIQQTIINALDSGEFVHIKGKGSNTTDIKVRLHELKNPDRESNFFNCVADVNIPVGEVFTSPVLKDTDGILHLEEIFLDGLKYTDLKLNFKDGYIRSYTCNNFTSEEQNKKYVEENLLFPHKSLPLGEFAIGTNTYAYVMAKRHGIVDILPVLIIEKMGPHFAIGDTCFSWSEDTAVYNMTDKKEVIARDNERSILRTTNVNEAYTNKHTDITLPYDALEFISVLTKEGKSVDIIVDGRFVLPGTEKLNEPFGG